MTDTSIYGAISAHGVLIKDELVLIPDGIYLKPLSTLGKMVSTAEQLNKETRYELNDAAGRYYGWDTFASDESHCYNPGDLIHNMQLHFKVTWVIEGINYYYTTGIITHSKLMDNIQSVGKDVDVKKSCLVSHDKDIILNKDMDKDLWDRDIWDKTYTLGEILKIIKNNNREGHYYLIACRGVDPITMKPVVESYCHPQSESKSEDGIPIPPPLRQDSAAPVLKIFTEKISNIKGYHDTLLHVSDYGKKYDKIVATITSSYIITKDDYCYMCKYNDLITQIKSKRDDLMDKLNMNVIDMNDVFVNIEAVMEFIKFSENNVDKKIVALINKIITDGITIYNSTKNPKTTQTPKNTPCKFSETVLKFYTIITGKYEKDNIVIELLKYLKSFPTLNNRHLVLFFVPICYGGLIMNANSIDYKIQSLMKRINLQKRGGGRGMYYNIYVKNKINYIYLAKGGSRQHSIR
jgi:hypothetical protein